MIPFTPTDRDCPICRAPVLGRRDKVFCSPKCKSDYHHELRRRTAAYASDIDEILHRNRSILYEIMGPNRRKKIIPRKLLDQKKFNFHHITSYKINKQGKEYRYVYDYAYMEFSNEEVLIIRK